MARNSSGKSSSGGASPDDNLSAKLDEWSGEPSAAEVSTWDECSPALIAGAVHEVTRAGGGILFGRSRDGAALSVTVMWRDTKKTRWIGPEKEPEEVLESLIRIYEALGR